MIVTQSKSDVIPAQRRYQVLELIRRKGMISVHDLADAVGVSLPTIRRDLDWLSKTGAVQRSHGGAAIKTVPGTTFEPEHHITSSIAREEKTAIGRKAAERLQDNQSVIFDSSSTVYEAACRVVEKGLRLTAVTNDIRIGERLAGSPSVHLLVIGGSLRPGSYTLVGEPGVSFLRRLHVDVAVMGIHAINQAACCDTSLEVAYVKRYMADAAKQVLVLADAAKFGQVAFFDAFDVDERFEIITDRPFSNSTCRALADKGVAVTIAGKVDE